MKKKWVALLSALTVCAAAFSLAACGETSNDSQPQDSTPPSSGTETTFDGEVVLTETELGLLLGDNYDLRATDGKNPLICEWEVENDGVVTVDEWGTLTAVGLGQTNVKATYEGKQATCRVSVGLGSYLPTVEFVGGVEDGAQVDMLNQLDLSAYVRFNGKKYDDATITYTYSDADVGEIKDGVFIPKKVGETDVTVTASWRGVDSMFLQKTVTVSVIHSILLTLNGKAAPMEIELYTVDFFDGKEYVAESEFVPGIIVNGKAEEVTVSVLNEEVAAYDDVAGKLVGASNGRTEAVIGYTNGEDIVFETSIPIKVITPVALYAETVDNFSAIDGELLAANGENLLTKLFTDGVYSATQGETQLDVSKAGKLLGVKTETHEKTKTQLTVYGKKYGYTFNVEGYTKVVDEVEDLLDFQLRADRKNVEGYFFMTKDIDFSTYDFNGDGQLNYGDALHSVDAGSGMLTDVRSNGKKGGFTGVFDGNGHSIDGYRMGQSWGFMASASNATLKNVGFTNVDTYGWRGVMFCWWAGNSTYPVYIENVYVSFNTGDMNNGTGYNKKSFFTLFNSQRSGHVRVNGLVVDMKEGMKELCTQDAESNVGSVGFFGFDNYCSMYANSTDSWVYKGAELKNIYVVAPPNTTTGKIMPMQQYAGVTVYAANDYAAMAEGTKVSFNTNNNPVEDANGGTSVYHYQYVYRYDTYDALRESGVTSVGNWSFASGTPVWAK